MTCIASLCRPAACLLTIALLAPAARAQEVSTVSLQGVPPDLIESDAPARAAGRSAPVPAVDLGQNLNDGGSHTAASAASIPGGVAARAAVAALPGGARNQAGRTRRPPPTQAQQRAGVERAIFERQPISVPLPVGRERLITLPAPAALHVPNDMAQVARLEVIDRTIYATALVPFTTIRIVAELIDSGQQIPMDLVAGPSSSGAVAELEVFSVEPERLARASDTATASASAAEASPTSEAPAADMVELTRHAARQLYAPRRLAWTPAGVQQVDVELQPVPSLIRGANVEAVPLGQWRAGQLYVTAVRVSNRSARPMELPLDELRGHWLAATAQHGRIGPAGSDTDTTALYLVCDRAFSACLR